MSSLSSSSSLRDIPTTTYLTSVWLQLPVKEDNIVFCPLTPLQIEVYKRLLGTDEVQFLARHADPCPCGKTDDDG